MIPSETESLQWWALLLETNGEQKALEKIENFLSPETGKYEIFHPRRIMLEYRKGEFQLVEKALYPGYSFIKCSRSFLSILLLQRPSGFYSVVKIGIEVTPVYDEEIENVKSLVSKEGVVGISEGTLLNRRVHITSGPLVGHEAKICGLSKRKKRVQIVTTIGNKQIKLELACFIH